VPNSPEHVDEAPATVHARLLDQGVYLAWVPTMYRVLRDHDEVRERRRQATHPAAKKPELLATRPNQVYSWDITKLLGPAKWTWYDLDVILDIYWRSVPGWMLATPRPPAWPRRCWPTPPPSSTSDVASSPSTPTGARR
jgi:putative transposase